MPKSCAAGSTVSAAKAASINLIENAKWRSIKVQVRCPEFYRCPALENSAYKQDGDAIREGDVIGLIEVMKQFTEAHADRQK